MKKLITVLLLGSVTQAHSGAFIFAGDSNGVNLITHPQGYISSPPDVLEVEVCINPNSTVTNELVIPVQNIVNTFNKFESKDSNVNFGEIPFSNFDWESVALHEVGHCLGLAHPNLGGQTTNGVSGDDTNFTNTTLGADGADDFGIGSDGIRGSRDDNRHDDQNLHWFNIGINNPFIASPPFDSSNYSRDVTDLPNSHNFVANADFNVGSSLGFSNSEAVMQQGTSNNQTQRDLGVDDVATLSLGMSSTDLIAGTQDDYSIKLSYGGISNASSCDINISHIVTSGFAVCRTGGQFVNGNHVRITTAEIEISDAFEWYYNQESNINDLIFENGFEN